MGANLEIGHAHLNSRRNQSDYIQQLSFRPSWKNEGTILKREKKWTILEKVVDGTKIEGNTPALHVIRIS